MKKAKGYRYDGGKGGAGGHSGGKMEIIVLKQQ